MSLFKSIIFCVFLSFFAVNCVQFTPGPEERCNFLQNSNKQRVSWKSSLPIRFRVHKDVPREAIPSILKAAKNWNAISITNVIEFDDLEAEGSPSASYADGIPMIFWKKDWEEHKTSEQARTISVWRGSKLKDTDIWINAKNFRFSYLDENFNPFKVDLVSLVVHEMGHALGFGHNPDEESVMHAGLKRGYDRREIGYLEDLESFGCEYGEAMLDQNNLIALAQRQTEENRGIADFEPKTPEEKSELASSAQKESVVGEGASKEI